MWRRCRALLGRVAAQPRFRAAPGLGGSSSQPLDLTDEDMIAQAARHVRGIEADVRLVMHVPGLLQMGRFTSKKNWRDLDAVYLARAFAVPFATTRLETYSPAVAPCHRCFTNRLTAEARGGFFDWRGQQAPW